jgi:hypothetical protein
MTKTNESEIHSDLRKNTAKDLNILNNSSALEYDDSSPTLSV